MVIIKSLIISGHGNNWVRRPVTHDSTPLSVEAPPPWENRAKSAPETFEVELVKIRSETEKKKSETEKKNESVKIRSESEINK